MLIIGFSVEAQQNQLPNIEIIAGNRPEWVEFIPQSENMLWGIGAGKLSSDNASCELAKFDAQTDLCRKISFYAIASYTEWGNPSPAEQSLLDELNLYRDEFNILLCLMASAEVSFELSEFIKVEQRAKTEDGTIWYLVSIQKDIADNIATKISDYEHDYIDS
jgi:hypothetical protein